MENTQNQNSIPGQIPSAKQKPGPGVLAAGVGAFLVVMMFVFGGCNFGGGGNDRTVVEYEQTIRPVSQPVSIPSWVNNHEPPG